MADPQRVLPNPMGSEADTFSFLGPNSLRLFGRHWRASDRKATIFGVHGYTEHGGRYQQFAEFLTLKGYDFIFLDLPGHGLSEGRRSNIDDFQDYVSSLEKLVMYSREHRGAKGPFHLFAHSLGGLVSMRFLQTSFLADDFISFTTTSPLLGLHRFNPSFLPVLGILTRFLPNLTLNNESELGENCLTHDKEIMAARAADPLMKARVTIHWVREFIKARHSAFADAAKIKIPVGIFQAEDEKVVDRHEVERFSKLLSNPENVFKLYPGMLHEVLNELDRARVMKDIGSWLESLKGSD